MSSMDTKAVHSIRGEALHVVIASYNKFLEIHEKDLFIKSNTSIASVMAFWQWREGSILEMIQTLMINYKD